MDKHKKSFDLDYVIAVYEKPYTKDGRKITKTDTKCRCTACKIEHIVEWGSNPLCFSCFKEWNKDKKTFWKKHREKPLHNGYAFIDD